MKRITLRLIALFVTFSFGGIITFIVARYKQPPTTTMNGELSLGNQPSLKTVAVTAVVPLPDELDEAKAVRLAEEFVAQNGYTDLPADKDKITSETVEFGNNLDERLKFRANTLERKAYGILYKATGTKMGQKGWTVVFQEKNVSDDFYKSLSQQMGKKITRENFPVGRAVTMDDNFQNLLVEHKTFPLLNVDKKL